MRSVVIGLRLCGIALEPFWPARNGSSTSRTSVRCRWRISWREALEPGAGERDRAQQLGVAVARDDLGRDRLGGEPEPLEHARLELRPERGVGADRAGDRADRGLRERALEPLGVAVRLEREPGELEAERGRLGVHAVGAADAQRAGVRARLLGQRRAPARARPARSPSPARWSCSASAVSSTSEDVRPKWIQRPAGPAEAASTSTNAATSWSVTCSRSLTASTVNVAPRIASRSSGGRPVERLGGRDLDVAPRGHARLVGPDRARARGRV